MSISPVGSPLIACCYTFLFLFLIFCLMQAISESVHVSWDTQLEQNRTRRICRTPRARRNKKSWDTPLFSAQLTAVPSRSLCSVYIHAYTWFASSIKATQCSHYAVDHLRSVSSQGHNLPTFSLQPSMAWLGYGLTRLVDILQQSAVSKVYTLLTLPSKTPGRTEDRMRSDWPKCNWAPSDQWNNIKLH